MGSGYRRICSLVGALCFGLVAGLAHADKRVALVIGNSNYAFASRLANPENDARDVAETLRELGFEIVLRSNADKASLDSALAEFERKAKNVDVSLFFYAGHGLQFRGRNYLLPVDAKLEDEVSLRYETLAIDKVRDALEAAGGVRVLILDACRDSPLKDKLMTRTASRYAWRRLQPWFGADSIGRTGSSWPMRRRRTRSRRMARAATAPSPLR